MQFFSRWPISAAVEDHQHSIDTGDAAPAAEVAGGRSGGYRLPLLAAMLLLGALFFALDLDRYLTLETFKAQRDQMVAAFSANPVPFAAAFMAIEITALALCLPGAVLTLALAGGAIFGFAPGLPIVLTAMVIGDSIAFLVARYLARNWVERQLGRHVGTVRRRTERNGAFYLLSLRLLAVIPFFVVNLAMGLTRMPLKIFAPVSFIGLLPATAVYVFTGTKLSEIETPSDIYSAELIATFLLLAMVPLAGAVARGRSRARQVSGDGRLPR